MQTHLKENPYEDHSNISKTAKTVTHLRRKHVTPNKENLIIFFKKERKERKEKQRETDRQKETNSLQPEVHGGRGCKESPV